MYINNPAGNQGTCFLDPPRAEDKTVRLRNTSCPLFRRKAVSWIDLFWIKFSNSGVKISYNWFSSF